MTPATLRVLTAVCSYLSVDLDLVRSGSQLPRCVHARGVAMYVMRQHFKPRPTLEDIGVEFRRHYSNVVYALRRTKLRLTEDETAGAVQAGRHAVARSHVPWTKERALEEARARVRALEAELGIAPSGEGAAA